MEEFEGSNLHCCLDWNLGGGRIWAPMDMFRNAMMMTKTTNHSLRRLSSNLSLFMLCLIFLFSSKPFTFPLSAALVSSNHIPHLATSLAPYISTSICGRSPSSVFSKSRLQDTDKFFTWIYMFGLSTLISELKYTYCLSKLFAYSEYLFKKHSAKLY